MPDFTVEQTYIAATVALSLVVAIIGLRACHLWPFAAKTCIHPGCSRYEKPTRYCPDGHPLKPGYHGPVKARGAAKAPVPVALDD